MIINSNSSQVVHNTMGVQNQFQIKTSAKSFQILSNNLYSNKILAVIREYCTNAVDAHVQAKVDKPFTVTLPTVLESVFTVRDYGNGLSIDQVKEFFCTYFSSSKSDSNDYVGALGLGCKSGFAYTDSFTITSYHEGVETLYTMYLDNSLPNFTLISSKPTTETGVKISIPVKMQDVDEFKSNFINFATHLDSKYLEDEWKSQIPVKSSIVEGLSSLEYTANAPNRLFAVMGSVAYPLDSSSCPELTDYIGAFRNNFKGDLIFFIDFNIGELDINPSRESLSYDIQTKQNIIAKLDSITAKLEKLVESVTSTTKLFDYTTKLKELDLPFNVSGRLFKPYVEKEIKKAAENSHLFANFIRVVDRVNYRSSVLRRVDYSSLSNVLQSIAYNENELYIALLGFTKNTVQAIHASKEVATKAANSDVNVTVFYSEELDKAEEVLKTLTDREIILGFKGLAEAFKVENETKRARRVLKYIVKTYDFNTLKITGIEYFTSAELRAIFKEKFVLLDGRLSDANTYLPEDLKANTVFMTVRPNSYLLDDILSDNIQKLNTLKDERDREVYLNSLNLFDVLMALVSSSKYIAKDREGSDLALYGYPWGLVKSNVCNYLEDQVNSKTSGVESVTSFAQKIFYEDEELRKNLYKLSKDLSDYISLNPHYMFLIKAVTNSYEHKFNLFFNFLTKFDLSGCQDLFNVVYSDLKKFAEGLQYVVKS